MYLSSTDKIQVVLAGAVTTNQLSCVASWQDITSAGMTLPQSSSQAPTNSTTDVDLIAAPAASTNRQVVHINIYNADTVAATITVKKDVSGTDYVLVKSLLQVGDTLQWSRESGWTILKVSSQESVVITNFIANGTWTKPAGLKRILGVCVGAGGGGGSGRQGAAGENRFGGGGGGGGNVVWRQVAAADLPATVTVTIGTGGTGGAAQTSTSTNGNNGTTGGDTSFGALIIAKGGNLGAGGSTTAGTAGTGGASSASTPSYHPYSISGANAGAGGTNAGGSASTTGMVGGVACSGGAGGGGINNANTSATTGGSAGGVYSNGVASANTTVSAVARPDGSSNVAVFLLFSNTLTNTYGLGGGGAGGYPGSGGSGAGGYGGNYGGGGGGGTATLNGTSSGRGGDGGGGLCVIMEIY